MALRDRGLKRGDDGDTQLNWWHDDASDLDFEWYPGSHTVNIYQGGHNVDVFTSGLDQPTKRDIAASIRRWLREQVPEYERLGQFPSSYDEATHEERPYRKGIKPEDFGMSRRRGETKPRYDVIVDGRRTWRGLSDRDEAVMFAERATAGGAAGYATVTRNGRPMVTIDNSIRSADFQYRKGIKPEDFGMSRSRRPSTYAGWQKPAWKWPLITIGMATVIGIGVIRANTTPTPSPGAS